MAITFHANGTIEGLNNNNFRASMPSGSVLQVVESSYSGENSITNTSTPQQIFSGSITPKFSSEKVSFFDIENGVFTDAPTSSSYFKGQVVKDLQSILGIKFDYNNNVLTNVNQRKDMLNFLISYFEFHVPGFKKPKSVDILNEVFS